METEGVEGGAGAQELDLGLVDGCRVPWLAASGAGGVVEGRYDFFFVVGVYVVLRLDTIQ